MVQNVVGFAATCAISTYHHLSCEFEPCSGDITEILLKVALNNINQTNQLKQLHLGDFPKNEDFSFSENNLNIKWYERKVNILKQAQW